MTVCSKYPRELTHYDNQLKKNCFRKLKDNVWESKTKWQLMLKAQRNYHHKLTKSSFHTWLDFTGRKRQKKKKIETADKHFAIKMKQTAFSALKRNFEPVWVLKKKLDIMRKLKLEKRSWYLWRKYVGKSLRSKEIDLLTRKMRELHLVKTVIELWFINYTEKKFIEMKYLKSVMHHDRTLKRRSFIAWWNYHTRENFKKELTSNFLTQLELKLKGRFFMRLMQYTKHKKLYEKHVRCVTVFYETYLVRSVLDKWNVKYEELVESRNQDMYITAVKFHEGILLEKYFAKLKIWTSGEKSRNEATELFVIIKIKLYLDIWKKYHREKLLGSALEEKALKWRTHQLRLIYLTKVAEAFDEKRNENKKIEDFITFCNDRLKGESFRKWREFSFLKRTKKLKVHSAQNHFNCKILRKSFRLLHTYATRRIRKLSIVNYYNYKLLLKSYFRLKSYHGTKQIRRECVNKFQERCKVRLLRHAFAVLNDKTKNNRDKSLAADKVAEGKIKRKAYQSWKKFHQAKTRKNMLIKNNRTILEDVIIRNMVTKWWKKAQVRTTFKEELRQVKINQERRLARNYLQKWMNIIEKFRLLQENCKLFREVYTETIFQQYTLKLIEMWNDRRIVKEKENLAVRAEKELLTRRYFKRWVTYIAWKKEKLRECSARIFQPKHPHEGHSKVNLRRKQPMIPVYLRDELLCLRGRVPSYRFYSNGTQDGENLSVIY